MVGRNSMSLSLKTITLFLVLCSASTGQNSEALAIAQNLTNSRTRPQTLAKLLENPASYGPLLLDWIVTPPSNVEIREFNIGLVEALGLLKVEKSIPFLINNISMVRTGFSRTWLKDAKVIRKSLPALSALIEIGDAAVKPLIDRYYSLPSGEGDRRVSIVFALASIHSEETKEFLDEVVGLNKLELFFAQQHSTEKQDE
jgi:hypothetical protein